MNQQTVSQAAAVVPSGAPPKAPLALSRSLASRHVTMISFGGIMGAGLFVGSSVAILDVGPAVVFSYLIAGLLMLLVMRMMAEMAAAQPGARSFVEFVRAGLGNGTAFTAGWLYWYFWILVVPVEAIAGAKLLHAWIPAVPVPLIGIGLIAILTGVNLMSARSYGEFEFWFASIKVAAVVLFLILAAAYVAGLIAPHAIGLVNLTANGGFMPHGLRAVLAGVVTVFFALTGAEIVTVAAAESRDPGKALTQLTTSVTWRIMLFYVGSAFLIVAVVPWNQIISGESPFTHALATMHFGAAGAVMSVVILTAVLSCLNSAFYVTSRVLFTLAEKGDAPGWLVRLNARGVPTRSVLLGSAAGIIGLLANIAFPNTVFEFLVNASGALMLFVYLLSACAQIRLRQTRGAAGLTIRMWGYPWLSYATVVAIVAVLVAMGLTPDLSIQLGTSFVALAVVIGACLLVAWRRRRAGEAAGSSVLAASSAADERR
jgi:L-asparagine transporter-like permease